MPLCHLRRTIPLREGEDASVAHQSKGKRGSDEADTATEIDLYCSQSKPTICGFQWRKPSNLIIFPLHATHVFPSPSWSHQPSRKRDDPHDIPHADCGRLSGRVRNSSQAESCTSSIATPRSGGAALRPWRSGRPQDAILFMALLELTDELFVRGGAAVQYLFAAEMTVKDPACEVMRATLACRARWYGRGPVRPLFVSRMGL